MLQGPNPIHVFGAPFDLSHSLHWEMKSGRLKSGHLKSADPVVS